MGEARTYQRFIWEFDAEIEDPTAVASFNMDWTKDGDSVAMMEPEPLGNAAARALAAAAAAGIDAERERLGIKLLGGTFSPRPIDDDGHYSEITIPRMSGRDGDGNFTGPPIM